MSKNEHFNPEGYKDYPEKLRPFHWFCHKVLPLVYDDSLSYYELLCKLVHYLNETMKTVDSLIDEYADLTKAFDDLVKYVNTYFDNLDLTEEVRKILGEMAEDGRMSEIVKPLVNEEVDKKLDEMVANGTLLNLMKPFISITIAQEIEKVINETIKPYIESTTKSVFNENFDTRFDEDFDIRFGEDFAPNFKECFKGTNSIKYYYNYDEFTADLTAGNINAEKDVICVLTNKGYSSSSEPFYPAFPIYGVVFDNTTAELGKYIGKRILLETSDDTANYSYAVFNFEDRISYEWYDLIFNGGKYDIPNKTVINQSLPILDFCNHSFNYDTPEKIFRRFITYANCPDFTITTPITMDTGNSHNFRLFKHCTITNNLSTNISLGQTVFYNCYIKTDNPDHIFNFSECLFIGCDFDYSINFGNYVGNIIIEKWPQYETYSEDDKNIHIGFYDIVKHWINSLTPKSLDGINQNIKNILEKQKQQDTFNTEQEKINDAQEKFKTEQEKLNTDTSNKFDLAQRTLNQLNDIMYHTIKQYQESFDELGREDSINNYTILHVATTFDISGNRISGSLGTYPNQLKSSEPGHIEGLIISALHYQLFFGTGSFGTASIHTKSGIYYRTATDNDVWTDWIPYIHIGEN